MDKRYHEIKGNKLEHTCVLLIQKFVGCTPYLYANFWAFTKYSNQDTECKILISPIHTLVS